MSGYSVQKTRQYVRSTDRQYISHRIFSKAFSPRQCERIIESSRDLQPDAALVSLGGASSDEHDLTRKARVSWIDQEENFLWIFEKLDKIATAANKTYQFDLSGFTEDIQFTHYDEPGSFFDWHQDGLQGELSVRKLSAVVQLSAPDTYEGCDLEIFSVSLDETWWQSLVRQQGTVIVFPGFEYHRVTPLISGSRFSLVCWVGGAPFR